MSAASDLLAASAVLEAIRPQANIALTSGKAEDQPVCDAWTKALQRFRKACADYVAAA